MSEGLGKEKLIPYCPCIKCKSERNDQFTWHVTWHGGWLSPTYWEARFTCRCCIGCLKTDNWDNPDFIETVKKEYEKEIKQN